MVFFKKWAKIFIVLNVAVVLSCVTISEPDINRIQRAGISNLALPAEHIFASGQPTQSQLHVLAQSGIGHIINLRPESEKDWNEGALVESLGMNYHSIPINGVAGITYQNAEALSQLLAKLKAESILLHCSSGNRVGALMALDVYKSKGVSIEAAIEEGRRWGLTRLESTVRDKLSETLAQ